VGHSFGRLEVVGDTNWHRKCRSRSNHFPPCMNATPLNTEEWGEEEWEVWVAVGWAAELAWARV
jgi:hypothetical protein